MSRSLPRWRLGGDDLVEDAEDWYGSMLPMVRSSSAYLRSLKWKPPSISSSISQATICSMLQPGRWWPVSTSTLARGPAALQKT